MPRSEDIDRALATSIIPIFFLAGLMCWFVRRRCIRMGEKECHASTFGSAITELALDLQVNLTSDSLGRFISKESGYANLGPLRDQILQIHKCVRDIAHTPAHEGPQFMVYCEERPSSVNPTYTVHFMEGQKHEFPNADQTRIIDATTKFLKLVDNTTLIQFNDKILNGADADDFVVEEKRTQRVKVSYPSAFHKAGFGRTNHLPRSDSDRINFLAGHIDLVSSLPYSKEISSPCCLFDNQNGTNKVVTLYATLRATAPGAAAAQGYQQPSASLQEHAINDGFPGDSAV